MSADLTNRLVSAVQGGLILRLLTLVVNFGIIRVLVTSLGIGRYGEWSALQAAFLSIGSGDLGVGNSLQNELTSSLTRGDRQRTLKLITKGWQISALTSALFTCSAYMLLQAPMLRGASLEGTIVSLLVAAGLSGLMVICYQLVSIGAKIQTASLLAHHSQAVNAAATIIPNLIVLSICTIYTSASVYHLFAAFMATNLCVQAANTYQVLAKQLPGIQFKHWFVIDWALAKELVQSAGGFAIISVTSLIANNSDALILRVFASDVAAGEFILHQRVYNALAALSAVVMSPLWVATAEALIKKDAAWIEAVVRRYTTLAVVSCVALGCLFQLIGPASFRILTDQTVGFDREVMALVSMSGLIVNGSIALACVHLAGSDFPFLTYAAAAYLVLCLALKGTALMMQSVELFSAASGLAYLVTNTIPMCFRSKRFIRTRCEAKFDSAIGETEYRK